MSSGKTLNEVFSRLSVRRRYEVWFVRLGLSNGSGAWWFRYLLMNPGLPVRDQVPQRMPVQVWATWFPSDGAPKTVIQTFSISDLDLSAREDHPFHFRVRNNEITENSCRGILDVHGQTISWDLNYRSTFRTTLSDKGWIGFSRTPHSNATFSGRVTLDGRTVEGNPLGYGLQGHNCGYKHRGFWAWAHAYFPRPDGGSSTVEALIYDMPFGMLFRKAVLWHNGKSHIFRGLNEIRRNREDLSWGFRASTREGWQMEFSADASGPNVHRLAYEKTNGTGTFEVLNNSLARARVCLRRGNELCEELETATGAVLEMGGDVRTIV